ncbi:MAG: penicillin-binding transpeptidase domain-containing protein, partial [Spirochaetia bacterium]|nr:penicillin-binding transpeptidase domain-containing protein [Spirochaetia bacterium]
QFHQAGNGAVVVFEIKKDRNIFKEKPSLILKAMAGSRDFNDPEEGQVNGALAVRNGGSTLKPFIYAMAMEKLNLSPYSIIDDSESEFEAGYDGMYRPKNYDLNYWGKLTLRESLAASRNIPAVKLLKAGGIEEFYELLKKMEVAHINHSPEYYGPGMALGTTGLSLFEITRLYSSFITEGVLLPVEIGSDEKKQKLHFGTEAQIFNSDTAYRITHILADSEIRKKAFGRRSFLDFPFEVAAKTGTSKDYRDSWTIGYTSNYIVGVWVGNFSGESMQNISGVYGAGRIFHQVIRLLEENPHHKFSYPSEWREISICRISGKRSGPHCPRQTEHLLRGDDSPELCSGTHDTENIPGSLDSGLKKMIQSPSQGEIYIIDPHSPDHYQQIPLKIILPQKDGYTIAVNGKIFNPENSVLTRMLTLNEGRHRIEVFKDGISVDSAEFEIQY